MSTTLFCPLCGTALDENKHCKNPECTGKASSVSSAARSVRSGIAFLRTIKKTFTEKNKQIVPECIKSDLDEVPIRQYDIARLRNPLIFAFSEGRLQITNKRVLFRSTGDSLLGRNTLQYEFSLEEIAGVEIRKEVCFSLFTLLLLYVITLCISVFFPVFSIMHKVTVLSEILSLLALAGAIATCYFLRKHKYLAHALLSLCVVCLSAASVQMDTPVLSAVIGFIVSGLFLLNALLLVFAPNLVVAVKTKGGTPSIEIRRKRYKNEYTGFSQVMPGPDADIAIKEFGAIVREVQHTGTYKELSAEIKDTESI